jgi:hypothetical protein
LREWLLDKVQFVTVAVPLALLFARPPPKGSSSVLFPVIAQLLSVNRLLASLISAPSVSPPPFPFAIVRPEMLTIASELLMLKTLKLFPPEMVS